MTIGKNTIALIISGILVLGFFFAGVFGVLDYLIVKALLFSGFTIFAAVLIWVALKNQDQKKAPQD
ncbi:MAG: hypothetical protein HRU26_03635 [Psychroserpens sp.]|nr:hypothetical protein [Psychroserpens sp.]